MYVSQVSQLFFFMIFIGKDAYEEMQDGPPDGDVP